ncbi:MAG: DUF58 domain-containing protein [Actinomycetota bacterium]
MGATRRLGRRVGVTATGAAAALVAAGAYALARAASSRTLLLLVYGTVIVLIGSWMLGRRKPGLFAERSHLPRRVREGQAVDVQLTVGARRRVSTVILEDELHDRLGGAVRIPLPLVAPSHDQLHTYSFVPRLRGVYTVGPLVVSWSDPFGMTTHRAQLAEPVEIIVHPTVERVQDRVVTREWEDPPIRPPFSKPWPTGFEFYGMRDYVNGDDPRRIVWRASARTADDAGNMRFLVREAEQGITDRVAILLDTDRKGHSPGDPSDTFETAIRVAASIGVRHLEDGFALTVDTNEGRLVEALRGKRTRVRLLDELARLQPGHETLRAAVDRLVVRNRRDLHTVIVTPALDEETASRLRLLVQRGVSLVLALVAGDDPDPVAVHRAGALGCNVVEVPVGAPLEQTFRRVLVGGARR